MRATLSLRGGGEGRASRRDSFAPERERSECARSTAAVGVTTDDLSKGKKVEDLSRSSCSEGSLGHSPKEERRRKLELWFR